MRLHGVDFLLALFSLAALGLAETLDHFIKLFLEFIFGLDEALGYLLSVKFRVVLEVPHERILKCWLETR